MNSEKDLENTVLNHQDNTVVDTTGINPGLLICGTVTSYFHSSDYFLESLGVKKIHKLTKGYAINEDLKINKRWKQTKK